MITGNKYIKIAIIFAIILTTLIVVMYFIPGNDKNPDLPGLPLSSSNQLPAEAELPQEIVVEYNAVNQDVSGDVYWKDWDYTKKIAEFLVVSTNKESGLIQLSMSRPTDHTLSGKVINVNPTCSKEETLAVGSSNPLANYLKADFDLFETAVNGDVLYSFCLDEDCFNIGNGCILVSFSDNLDSTRRF